MTKEKMEFNLLPLWHQKIITKLLSTTFPGREQIKRQFDNAYFEIIDTNGSLKIYPQIQEKAPVEKTIPVEAWSYDKDGVLIQILLFTNNGIVYMIEILREDGNQVIEMPSADEFEVIVLGR